MCFQNAKKIRVNGFGILVIWLWKVLEMFLREFFANPDNGKVPYLMKLF